MGNTIIPRLTLAQRNNATGRLQAVTTHPAVARHIDVSIQTISSLWAVQHHSKCQRSGRHGVTTTAQNREREREMFYLTTHSTHFIYGYMASDIWLRTILIVRKETRCRHIGYSYRLTARVLLYAPSHRQDNTYHDLCYTSRGALTGTRNSSIGPPHEGSTHRTMSERSTSELRPAPARHDATPLKLLKVSSKSMPQGASSSKFNHNSNKYRYTNPWTTQNVRADNS